MRQGDALKTGAVAANQHFTQPPPRFSEATLVKKLEELGIGRPSTYASILQVLQDREYVRLDKRRFIPEDRGRLVTAFLVAFFEKYVDTGFTAGLEEKLDDISGGRADWRAVMRAFWDDFSKAIGATTVAVPHAPTSSMVLTSSQLTGRGCTVRPLSLASCISIRRSYGFRPTHTLTPRRFSLGHGHGAIAGRLHRLGLSHGGMVGAWRIIPTRRFIGGWVRGDRRDCGAKPLVMQRTTCWANVAIRNCVRIKFL
jgi:hypothetical protein